MRISDLSSDVCSSDLRLSTESKSIVLAQAISPKYCHTCLKSPSTTMAISRLDLETASEVAETQTQRPSRCVDYREERHWRSEEHTSELQSLMRISYAVFCLKTKKKNKPKKQSRQNTKH